MCTIVALLGVHPQFPVVLAANRDERYARPSAGPQRLPAPACAVAGRDLEHGGTWFGINDAGLAVAIADQGTSPSQTPKRSRGLLVLDALRCPSVAAVDALLAALAPDQYNPCTLLYAEPGAARLAPVGLREHRTPRVLAPGLHVMVSGIGAEHARAREQRVLGALDPVQLANARPEQLMAALTGLLRAHDSRPDADDALCRHGTQAGTVSSFVALLADRPTDSRFWCAVGPPCRTEYLDYSALLPRPLLQMEPIP
ncbi:MAG: NRDE family protein [Chloroflexi bacterium]|nr:NRDE family protein [Chloroflexota bacterium]